MDNISVELLNASNNIKNKTYFYNVLIFLINNTKYDNNLLIDYCKFVEKYDDYNENDKHTLYDTNIKLFINSFNNCSKEEKIQLNYEIQLNNLYKDILSYHLHIPSIQKDNIPKNVYKVLYFIIDNNNFNLARNLSIMIFKD